MDQMDGPVGAAVTAKELHFESDGRKVEVDCLYGLVLSKMSRMYLLGWRWPQNHLPNLLLAFIQAVVQEEVSIFQKILAWPFSSPYLNQTENLWEVLKQDI